MEKTIALDSLLFAARATLVLLVAFILGVFYSFLLRKVYARLQARRGPWLIVPKEARETLGLSRILQPLYDVLKLLYKESLIPETANKRLFKSAPYIALGSIALSVLFVPIAGSSPLGSFKFSLIIVLYLLLIPPLLLVIGGYSSSSPWGAIGAGREIELTLIYEVVQAFDIPDASVEIVAGPETEYSGKLLGILELGRIFSIFVYTALYLDLFIGGGVAFFPPFLFVVGGSVVVFALALINAINPRYRLDQAFVWYLKYQVPVGIMAIAWTYLIRFAVPL